MRAIKFVGGLVFVLLLGAVVMAGSMWMDHLRETMLVAPTGRFVVGRTLQVWSNADRPALMSPPGTKTQLAVWIWYPAVAQHEPRAYCDYLPTPLRIAIKHQRGKLINEILTRDLSRVRTHSVCDPGLSPERQTYPVVLMRAGLAGLVTGYTSIAEDLASHGYIVVGFDVPYRSAVVVLPDGKTIARAPENDADRVGGIEQEHLATRLIQAWSADLAFALDQLQRLNASDPSGKFLGKLDMERIGVFGHSLGGATALQFCHDDLRCKAGIDLDGAPLGDVVAEGVRQPFMFLMGDHTGDDAEETHKVFADIAAIYDRLPSDRRWRFMIRGANHYMFSDDGAMLKSPLVMRALRLSGVVPIDGRRQIAVASHSIAAFFDVYLRGAPASRITSQAGFPEIETIR